MSDASRYLLLDRLAVGGMAEIYRAKSLGIAGFEKIVAIKRVLPLLAEDDEFVEMFIEEAKIAGQLQHANIAAIFELGKIDDVHFIAMEYVFGKNVRRILDAQNAAGRRVPVPLAAWIGAQLLAGLDYAHRKRDGVGRPLGIIHRDVSPPNVIVSYDGLVKIVDFGIAKAASRAVQTVAGVIKGKLAYMSPEQVMGDPIDRRSDVFAAAALLHELLTGQRLFDGASDFEIIEQVRAAKAQPPSALNPEVPPELDDVVMRGLSRELNRRWESAGEMQEALVAATARPGAAFGTSALRDWMRTAFAEDYQVEKEKLERLAAVEKPGVALTSEAPSTPVDDPEEATIISAAPPSMHEPSEVIELSSLVLVEESFGAFERSAPIPLTEPRAPDLPPGVAVEEVSLSALQPLAPVLEPSAPIPLTQKPAVAPTSLAREPGGESVRPPSIRFETHQNPPLAVPEPEPEEEGGTPWGLLVLVALLALVIGAGGVVAALYFTGRPLPF